MHSGTTLFLTQKGDYVIWKKVRPQDPLLETYLCFNFHGCFSNCRTDYKLEKKAFLLLFLNLKGISCIMKSVAADLSVSVFPSCTKHKN